MIYSDAPCHVLSLPNVSFSLGLDLDAEIPPVFWTRKIERENRDGCQILFAINDENNDLADPIESEDDGPDFVSNKCYILGQPFLRAFITVFDFERNQMSFSQK